MYFLLMAISINNNIALINLRIMIKQAFFMIEKKLNKSNKTC